MIIGVNKTQQEGYWIPVDVEQCVPGIPYIWKKCSKCGFTHSLLIPDNYCPQCGSHNEGKYRPSIKEFLETYDNSRRQSTERR